MPQEIPTNVNISKDLRSTPTPESNEGEPLFPAGQPKGYGKELKLGAGQDEKGSAGDPPGPELC